MIYVSADWHGWPLEKILALLERAGFSDRDFLFVLGDVIDRGEQGVELLRWLSLQPNAQLLLGNHEAMLLSCAFLFEDVSEDSLSRLTAEKLASLQNWYENGGHPTVTALNRLLKEDPDTFEGILDYLRDAPLYETLDIDERSYVLVHGGIGHFDPEKPLVDYDPNDFLWARPTLQTRYYPDATVVFGHTPSFCFGEGYRGKPVFTDSWICIDTGAAAGHSPVLLRLDDGKLFF